MIEINANPNGAIPIGYAGENETRQAVFTYPAQWVEEFPNGSVELHVKRAGDGALYIATDTADDREERRFTWTITATDAAYSGRGEVQLCYLKDGKIVKSQRYITNVEISTAVGDIPEPPPPTIVQEAVDAYLEQYVDVITVSDHGTDGQVLQSDGDGSYSWLSVDNTVIDSDTGDTLVPTRMLNRLAQVIRQKTGYEGDMTVETMAEVLEQTDMWTTEEYCLNLAPAAAELTITLGALPQYALHGRQNIVKVVLPYCGVINDFGFSRSSVSIVIAPRITTIGAYAFDNCAALTEIVAPQLVNTRGGYNFQNCTALKTISLPSLRTTQGYLCYQDFALENVNLPNLETGYNGSEAISYLFGLCKALERIELPKYKGVFQTGCFDSCTSLKEAIFPKLSKITTNYNFRNCYDLAKLYAPECTVWNGTQNFLNCNSLRRMCFYTKPTTISNTLFSGAPVLMDIYVSWSQGEVAGAPWGAPAGCTVHYNTVYDEDGEPIT